MTTTKLSRPPTAPAQPARPIPIRIVPRAAVEALVARLDGAGVPPHRHGRGLSLWPLNQLSSAPARQA